MILGPRELTKYYENGTLHKRINMTLRSAIALVLILLTSIQGICQEKLWGMTPVGGSTGGGVVFNINKDGSDFEVVHDFTTPFAGRDPLYTKLLGIGDKLYGLTQKGGSHDAGVLFEYTPQTGAYEVKVSFNEENGKYPTGSLMLGSDGYVYGITFHVGTIFRYDPETEVLTTLYRFQYPNGYAGFGGLVEGPDRILYGMGRDGVLEEGTLFSFDLNNLEYTLLHRLSYSDGTRPTGDLLLASNGKLYGLAPKGGLNGFGTLFEYDIQADQFTKKYDFYVNEGPFVTPGAQPYGSLIELPNGNLCGLTYGGGEDYHSGVLFEYDIEDDEYIYKTSIQSDARFIFAHGEGTPLLASNGHFYGLGTEAAFAGNVLFDYNPTTGDISFTEFPPSKSSLTQASNGKFYTMAYAGINGSALIEFDPATKVITWKVQFDYAEFGAHPQGSLTRVGSKVYGVTEFGGELSENYGTIFEIDLNTNQFKKILDLTDQSGRPYGSLTRHSNGKLYGTATWASPIPSLSGSIFEFNPETESIERIIPFSNGGIPTAEYGTEAMGALTLASNGKFYGLTRSGGVGNYGVIYEFDPAGSQIVTKVHFQSTDGAAPVGHLVSGQDGFLYGLTQQGGVNLTGVIFKYSPGATSLTKVRDFNGSSGLVAPYSASLMLASDGLLYGIRTTNGTSNAGLIFSFNPSSQEYVEEYHFLQESNGFIPCGYLVESEGKLFGMTHNGVENYGSIFSFDMTSKNVDFIKTFDVLTGSYPMLNGLTLFNPLVLSTEGQSMTLNSIIAYPNPVEDVLNFNSESQIKSILVTDLTGACRLNINNLRFDEKSVDMRSLHKGIYVVSVTTADNITRHLKIVKR
jgi:Secretion system C-terminal sorting domain